MTYRTAVLSRGAAVLVGVGCVLPLIGAGTNVAAAAAIGIAGFLVGWFALGIQAIRLDRPVVSPA